MLHFGSAHGTWKFWGQGSNPHLAVTWATGSLTRWATGELISLLLIQRWRPKDIGKFIQRSQSLKSHDDETSAALHNVISLGRTPREWLTEPLLEPVRCWRWEKESGSLASQLWQTTIGGGWGGGLTRLRISEGPQRVGVRSKKGVMCSWHHKTRLAQGWRKGGENAYRSSAYW